MGLLLVAAAVWAATTTLTGALWLRRLWPGLPYAGPTVVVPRLECPVDRDGDGLDDLDDIVAGARLEVAARTRYHDGYYAGGYPPDGEGVCTDVIWRAFRAAGYELKNLVDQDIHDHTADYPRVAGRPEPNIDFRRVPNLRVFFSKSAARLTTEVRPGDAANLAEWQGGDIVIFGPPHEHIAIVSDRRRRWRAAARPQLRTLRHRGRPSPNLALARHRPLPLSRLGRGRLEESPPPGGNSAPKPSLEGDAAKCPLSVSTFVPTR